MRQKENTAYGQLVDEWAHGPLRLRNEWHLLIPGMFNFQRRNVVYLSATTVLFYDPMHNSKEHIQNKFDYAISYY